MKNVSQIIEALGGNSTVAAHIGVTPSGVSEMKRRGNIPVQYWPRLINLAAARGFHLNNDNLVAVHNADSAEQPEVSAPWN